MTKIELKKYVALQLFVTRYDYEAGGCLHVSLVPFVCGETRQYTLPDGVVLNNEEIASAVAVNDEPGGACVDAYVLKTYAKTCGLLG
jgi:hypothetical protein